MQAAEETETIEELNAAQMVAEQTAAPMVVDSTESKASLPASWAVWLIRA